MRTLWGLGLTLLLGAPATYATDCVTSFDQSCLSGGYSAEEVAAGQEHREEWIKQEEKREEEETKAEEKAMRERQKILREQEQTMREQERIELERQRLLIEWEKKRALERIGAATQGIGDAIDRLPR